MSESKIIDTILNDAVREADDIINHSRKQADLKIEKEKQALIEKQKECEKSFENEAKRILDGAAPAGEIAVKNAVLKAKRTEIEKTIDLIFSDILSLPDEDYFKVLKILLQKNNQSAKGQILFNAKDKKRMPKDFLAEFENLSLAENNADISGGFILKFDKIYIDCAFEAIKLEKYDDLVDFLNKELFK